MNNEINDDEKNKKIQELIKEEIEITERIKDKLKEEINKIDFILTKLEIDSMYNLVQEDIKEYFNKDEKRFKLIANSEYIIDKEKFFVDILRIIFKELEIIVKIKNEYISKVCFLFKGNEGVLISFLIENFRKINGIENEFEIYITRKELENLIEFYEVKDNFIDKLEKNKLLIIDKYNDNSLSILLKNSLYTYENESNLRKIIIQNYNLKINKEIDSKIKNEIKKYNIETKKIDKKIKGLEATINNLKIEIIAILSIFVGLFSYLTSNFNLAKDLLSGSKEIENLFFVGALFCIGLVPIIVMFFLLKYLFLMPNNDSKKLSFWKKYSVVIALSMTLIIAIIFIYLTFWNNYKKYNSNFEELKQNINIKMEEVQKLKKEVEYLKLKYEEQNREKLMENPNNSNNVIILRR